MYASQSASLTQGASRESPNQSVSKVVTSMQSGLNCIMQLNWTRTENIILQKFNIGAAPQVVCCKR